MSNAKISQESINQALEGNWQSAIDLNKKVIGDNPKDTEALCRLAKAYVELNKKKLAIKTYRKILKLDKFNPIAKNNLNKLSNKKAFNKHKNNNNINPDLFLEEPGKTKIISLISLGDPKILADLNINDSAKLVCRKRSLSVYNESRHYLGKIPDDLSFRLIKLIKSGNKYKTVIRSADNKNISIFIKEIKRSKKNSSIPSFPFAKEKYFSFAPTTMVKRSPIQEIEEREE